MIVYYIFFINTSEIEIDNQKYLDVRPAQLRSFFTRQ
jgi:hypothetical protein